MRRFRTLALGAFASIALIPAASNAQTLAVPGRTPESAAAVLSISDTKTMWSNIAKSPVRKGFNDFFASRAIAQNADWNTFLADQAKIEESLGFSLNPDSLLTETISGLDVYFVSGAGAIAQPGVGAVIKFNSEANAKKLLEQLLAEAKGATGGAPGTAAANALAEKPVGTTTLYSLEGLDLHLATDGPIFVFGTSESAATEILLAKDTSQFTKTADFSSSFKTIGQKPHQMWMYGDGSKLAPMLAPFLQEVEGLDVEQLLGRVGQSSVAAVATFDQSYTKFTSFQPASSLSPVEAQLSLIPAVASPKLNSYLPGTFMMVASANGPDGPVMFDAMLEAVAETPDMKEQGMTKEMLKSQLSAADVMLGFSVENDLIGSIGNEYGFAISRISYVPPMQLTGEALFAFKLNDAAKFGSAFRKIEDLVSQQMMQQMQGSGQAAPAGFSAFKEVAHGGATLRSLELPNVPGIAPTYTITPDNYFLLGLTAESVQNAIDAAAGSKSSLAASPALESGATLLPKSPNSLFAIDIPRVTDFAKNLALMFGGMSGEDAELLEAGSTLAKSFGVMANTTTLSPEGKTAEVVFLLQ